MVSIRGGCVYIITNKTHSVLYTGVTSDLMGRIWEHRNKVHPTSFTAKCNCTILVYYCFYSTIQEAIATEKAIKAGSRQDKIDLISSINIEWKDLYEGLLSE